jgi:hypothetical protein
MTMVGDRYREIGDDEDLLEFAASVRRERDERIAKIRETKYEVEPSPKLKALVDSQQEYRDRIMRELRSALFG